MNGIRNKGIKTKTAVIILNLLLATAALSATDSNSLIGKSAKSIELQGATTSKTFKIWNKGTGKMSYTLSVTVGEHYFAVTPTSGDSNGPSYANVHTVTVDYNVIPHGETVTGKITISDGKTTQDINLSATETVASHVRSVKIEHGIDFNEQDDNDPNYVFRINITTDNSAARVAFVAPDGDPCDPCVITKTDYADNNQIETWHSENAGEHSWIYQARFSYFNGLTAYWNGKYTVKIIYNDSAEAETEVGFSIPERPGAIPQPTQEPNMTSPSKDGNTVSPVRFAWDKCSDSNVDSILFGYKRPDGNNWAEQEYGKNTTKTGLFNLDYGEWRSELVFGRWYQAKNSDDIDINVGKYIKSHSSFVVTNKFGTFNELKGHPLQLEDCNGHLVTFTLTGGGEGLVDNDCNFNSIILRGTTEKSVLSITTVGNAKTSIGNIDANGPIKAIIGRNVDLKGDITIDGCATMIVMGDVPGDSNITFGSPASPKTTCAMKFGEVNNLALTSGTPIKELRAIEWKSGSLDAPWISNLTIDGNAAGGIAGDFNANITLSGEGSPKNLALKKVKIAGGFGETIWDINGDCGAIEIAGEPCGTTWNITGNYGTIKIAGGLDKTIWNINGDCGTIEIAEGLRETTWNIAGDCGTIKLARSSQSFDANIIGSIGTLTAVGNKTMNLPSVLSGAWSFASVKTIVAEEISECNITATQEPNMPAIGKVTATGWISNCHIETAGDAGSITSGGIRNSSMGSINAPNSLGHLQIKGINGEAYCFINSSITAKHIGNAYLAYPKTFNYGTPFGLTADSIDTLTIKDSVSTKTWSNLKISAADTITIEDLVISLE
jgi:hypothetical protein